MTNLFSRFWKFLNAPRLLEIDGLKIKYYMLERYNKPIVENIEEELFYVPFLKDVKKQFLNENEKDSINLCKKYIFKVYKNQGLIPTKRQLKTETLTMWENYKSSNLVDDYLRIKEDVQKTILEFCNK
jgi:hypothetical protein